MQTKTVVTDEQYRSLQRPVVLPTPAELFDFEVETLKDKGLLTYDQADPFRKALPAGLFLLIPPKPDPYDLAHLMGLVVVNGKAGRSYLDPANLADEIEMPNLPYLLCDIEDGNSRRNIRPSENRQAILGEGRSPYVVWEGIVHTIVFPQVLLHHNLDLVGSRDRSKYWPYLSLSRDQPELHANWRDDADPRWGAPSLGRRLVP
ncbi:MAG: hypothetical protein HY566_01465 [Candidatus Kerfeldbacteria bacterium]|nr:hypothetical protein [Candidatus Kerfeldbacteria bacterium]